MMFIYTICASEEETQKITEALLRARLVACANWWPIRSFYRWKGKIEKEKETALLLKTQEKNFSKIEKIIKNCTATACRAFAGGRLGK
jgi:periplasmic divalent cation tolerance protein